MLLGFLNKKKHVLHRACGNEDIPIPTKGISMGLSRRGNSTENNNDESRLESPILRLKLPQTPLNLGSLSPVSDMESPLGQALGEHIKRRQFKKVALKRADVNDIDVETAAIFLKPFWSNISATLVDWGKDADIGIVLEHRQVVTSTGYDRKNVVSVRKIWSWSPVFSSGTRTVNDILVSVDGQSVAKMKLADV